MIVEHIPLNSLACWGVFHLSLDEGALVPSSEARGFLGRRVLLMWRDYIGFFS
jgi:hypothetical protein